MPPHFASSKPLQAPNVTRARGAHKIGAAVTRIRVQNGQNEKNTVIKSLAVSSNGAFIPVNVLSRHATAHSPIKKRIEEKKRIEKSKIKSTPLPTICLMSTIDPIGVTETYDNAGSQSRTNTLFTSHNWGNQK